MHWPKDAADVFFYIGMCFVELKEYQSALDSLNSSLKINSEFAEVSSEPFIVDIISIHSSVSLFHYLTLILTLFHHLLR